MAIRVSKKVLTIVSVIAFLVLAGVGGYTAWRISQEREVTPEESEAQGSYNHKAGDTWNECCADCKSQKVTCTSDDGQGNCTGWDKGPCDQPDTACCQGEPCVRAGFGCSSDGDCCTNHCAGGICVNQESTCTPNGDGCTLDSHCCSGNCDDGTCRFEIEPGPIECPAGCCGGVCGDCAADEVCDVWNGSCPSGYSCRTANCKGPGIGCGENWECCSGICSGNFCIEGEPCKTGGESCDANSDCCSNECDMNLGVCTGTPASGSVTCECHSTGKGGVCSATNTGTSDAEITYHIVQCRNNVPCDGFCGAGVCFNAPAQTVIVPAGGSVGLGSVGSKCDTEWQLDVCGDVECSWIDCVECDEPKEDEPYCGDGTLDAGEECELGDPAGAACSWATKCDQSTCTCPAVLPEYIQVSGEVFCQDDNDERFPVQGAEIYFYKTSDPDASENLATGASGSFLSAANTTQTTDGPFAVRYSGLADPSRTLSNGTSYSQMTGPVLESPDVCTAGRCDTCGASYEQCSGLTDPTTYSGFDWVFANCSQELPNPDWDIEKEGSVVCYEDGKVNAYAQASYVITVTNVAEGGTVRYVTDEFDEQVDESWITSTAPTATSIEDGVITWTLSGSDGEFTEGESMEFRYSVSIPQTIFDEELSNHAIARLSTGEDLHAYEDVIVTCSLPEDETVPGQATVPGQGPLPETGLLDSAVGRVAIGSVLIVMSYAYYKFGLIDTAIEWLSGSAGMLAGKVRYVFGSDGKKERWEKRMVKDIDKRGKKR